MADVQPAEGDLIDASVDVSGPLDVRRLQGNARCTRCKEANNDCYLERRKQGDLRCLTCSSAAECQFRRIVVRKGPTADFSWEELIGDEPAEVLSTSNHLPRKRPRHTTLADAQYYPSQPQLVQPPISFTHYNVSIISEPANSVYVSTSPHSARKTKHDIAHDATNQDPDVASMGAWLHNPWLYTSEDPEFGDPHSFVNRVEHTKDQLVDILSSSNGMPSIDQSQSMYSLSAPPSDWMTSPSRTSRSMLKPPDPSQPPENGELSPSLRCPKCDEIFNTKSEMSKHMARHNKSFLCEVPGCPRNTDGFATKNDLDRHKGSVHRMGHALRRHEYKCVVPGCKDPMKMWDRKDNFKAHVKRMHPDEDADDIVQKSKIDATPPYKVLDTLPPPAPFPKDTDRHPRSPQQIPISLPPIQTLANPRFETEQ